MAAFYDQLAQIRQALNSVKVKCCDLTVDWKIYQLFFHFGPEIDIKSETIIIS